MKRKLKYISVFVLILLAILLLLFANLGLFIHLKPPSITDTDIAKQPIIKKDATRQLGTNWIRLDETGIWEMYIEGKPFDRGFAAGKMGEDLLRFQEQVFVDQVEEFVPNSMYRRFLLNAIKLYNRNLNDHVPLEYREEIYGVSRSAPSEHDYLGSKYERKLSFHAAHDIGHAFQNMGFVSGCSALAARDSATNDLLLGRNFDFYIGEDFAKNKIVSFVRPIEGHAFVSLAWPAMMGVVSGMNEHGLVVVLNAGPSDMPKGVKTPVTILAREILQYAKTISEATAIARQRDVFVSENFIVASGEEDRVVSIEKSPGTTAIWETAPQSFVCTNHFQSEQNNITAANRRAQVQTSTTYRFNRIEELKSQNPIHTVNDLVDVLRNTGGTNNERLGLGNELAINQLTGLHSIIFNPTKKHVYIAGVPSQIGPYLKYDLSDIFSNKYKEPQRLWQDSLPADPLLYSPSYEKFSKFQRLAKKLEIDIRNQRSWSEYELLAFEQLNPGHYQTYLLLGSYYGQIGDCLQGVKYFKKALTMPIPWATDRESLEAAINACE